GFPFHPAQIVTSFFAHIEIFHFLFNMLALASLGPMLEMVLGVKRFLRLYLFCGVFAGILLAFIDPSDASVLGASTAVSGVFAAFALMYPDRQISLFILPPIEARKLLIGAAAISGVLMLVDLNGGDGGGISHFGHLAGMLGALVYQKIEPHLPFRD
ncbi:MAG: rhomboid family intramembrane serine protease, partial [Bacteroidota bacterium]